MTTSDVKTKYVPSGKTATLLARFSAADAIKNDPLARWRVDFPTAVALLEHWEKPWASRLERFAMTRLIFMWNAGFDVLEVGPLPSHQDE